MALKIEPVGCPAVLGEGPYWDEETQTLYFVDIKTYAIHSYNSKTNEHHFVDVESGGLPVSFIVKIKGEQHKFVISVKNSLAIVCWDGISSKALVPEHLLDLEEKEEMTRLNDGKCDPSNRLWAGTMGAKVPGTYEKDNGSLYLLNRDKTIMKCLSKIGISNGLAWSLDKTKMYYIDSLKYRVDSYDYDDATGSISNEQTIFCFKKNNLEGFPDGMTIDQEGMLWVACFGGAQVLRINPNTGKITQTLKIPSLQVTSVAFGGPNFEDLFVTTAKCYMTEEMEEKYPLAGNTFRVNGLGVKGTPSIPIVL